jgi:serine protease
VTIDFAAEFERNRRREFKVTGVAFASPDRIDGQLNPANLDVALLNVEADNGTEALPPRLPLSRRITIGNGVGMVYVMGYPARPTNGVGEVLRRIFLDEYSVKRFAPGFVKDSADAFDDGGHKRVFTHDASTLQGNSGSCIVEFMTDGRPAVGLHFGGRSTEQRNFGHAIARLESALAQHGVVLQD